VTEAHQKCVDAGEHICQVPSGRTCIERGCDAKAGTHWGPYWCPEHDKERLDRISASFAEIERELRGGAS
jgi:hypothetical protein